MPNLEHAMMIARSHVTTDSHSYETGQATARALTSDFEGTAKRCPRLFDGAEAWIGMMRWGEIDTVASRPGFHNYPNPILAITE
jgi:hypothetical protein